MRTLITIPDPDLRKIVLSQEALESLSSVSEVDWVKEGTAYCGPPLKDIIEKYDAVISGWKSPKLSAPILERAVNLKFFGQAAGTVIPFIDISAYDRGIVIVNANSQLAASTAEFAMSLILAAVWEIPSYLERLGKGSWSDNDRETVMGLEKQVVGIVGLGEISRRLIRFLQPFNPRILLYSRYCSREEAESLGVSLAGLDELLSASAIVSLHSTLNESTRGMIGRQELARLQDGALLVNTARSGIVDQDALLAELHSGRLRAALDVFDEEPLPQGHPLTELENVICTPHIGGFSSYWKKRLGMAVINDLKRFLQGEALENEVSREFYLRQTPR